MFPSSLQIPYLFLFSSALVFVNVQGPTVWRQTCECIMPLRCSYTSLDLWHAACSATYRCFNERTHWNRQTIINNNNRKHMKHRFFSPTILSIVSVSLAHRHYFCPCVRVCVLLVLFFFVSASPSSFHSVLAIHLSWNEVEKDGRSVRAHIADVQLHECKCIIFHF